VTTLDAIPPLRGKDPGTGTATRRRIRKDRLAQGSDTGWGVSRRTMFTAGTALGLAAIGVFPAARRAYADGYSIYTRCPSYATNHDCSPGCGPSTIFADSCETSGANIGFHKDDGITWTLRPNQCYNQTYDGWLWRYQGACGACACYVERRCHDGWRITSSGSIRSICRWNTRCGCLGRVAWPTTRRGETSVNVSTVQELLGFRGYPTTVDGIFGPNTEARVREFESGAGLPVDGIVDAGTWTALVVEVRRGNNNQAVRGAQRQLNRYGYALAVDGAFGPATESAVRDLQLTNGLTVDGVVAITTWRNLTGGAGV
jgi:hypothetical protein